jgi:hypothetical protein
VLLSAVVVLLVHHFFAPSQASVFGGVMNDL